MRVAKDAVDTEIVLLRDFQQYMMSSERKLGDFYIEVKKIGDKYVLSEGLAGLNGDRGGRIRSKDDSIKYWSKGDASVFDINFEGGAKPDKGRAPLNGEILMIITVLASAKVAAIVADRVLTLEFSPGLAYDIGAAADYFFNSNDPAGDAVTMSTGQFGYIYYAFGLGVSGGIGHTSDNGTRAPAINIPGPPYMLCSATQGGQLTAHLNNAQNLDLLRLSMFYQVVGHCDEG